MGSQHRRPLLAKLHRDLAAILKKHLGPKPKVPVTIMSAIQELNGLILEMEARSAAEGPRSASGSDDAIKVMLNSTMDCIALIDTAGRILGYNHRFVDLWNLPEDVIETGLFEKILPNILFELRNPELFERCLAEVKAGKLDTRTEVLEFADGRYFEMNSQPQTLPNGGTARTWSFRDVSQIKRAEEGFRHDAFHDALTGLPNRSLFADRLGQAIAQAKRNRSQLAVMFMDLDKFKSVNDTLGHGAGDELLTSVASRLRSRVRAQDTLSRLSGDEFMVLITELQSSDAAGHVAESILDTLRLPFRIDGHAVHIGASIGISIFPMHGDDAESLMRNADVALYQAKEGGRNRYKAYIDGMGNPSTEKVVFENDLRSAVAKDELVVHYQPIVDLRSGGIQAVEALVRWKRGDGPLIPPARFIPIAESAGLIGAISEWVLKTAAATNRKWTQVTGKEIQVSVNYSAQQFWDPHLVDKIESQLEVADMDPASLILEITESTIMQDPTRGVETLQKLRDLGVSVALDDFGTGHSSLSFLRHMPISTLKIDRSFVAQCDREKRDGAIVAAVIQMARSLGLHVVAEGVETKSQAQFLKRQGCDAIQGYWFSKPVPESDLRTLLKSRSQGSPRREPIAQVP